MCTSSYSGDQIWLCPVSVMGLNFGATSLLSMVCAYLPSDPNLAGLTSIYIVKSADQQDQPKTSIANLMLSAVLNMC